MTTENISNLVKWLKSLSEGKEETSELFKLINLVPLQGLSQEEQTLIVKSLSEEETVLAAGTVHKLIQKLEINESELKQASGLVSAILALIPVFPISERKKLSTAVSLLKNSIRGKVLATPPLQRPLLLLESSNLFRRDQFLEHLYQSQEPLNYQQSYDLFVEAGKLGISSSYINQLKKLILERTLFGIRLIEYEEHTKPEHADLLLPLSMDENFIISMRASRVLGHMATKHKFFQYLWKEMIDSPNRLRQLKALSGLGELIDGPDGEKYREIISQFINNYGYYHRIKIPFEPQIEKLLQTSQEARCHLISSLGRYFINDISQISVLFDKIEEHDFGSAPLISSFMASLWLLADCFNKKMTGVIREILDRIESNLKLSVSSLKYTGDAVQYDQWMTFFHTCASFGLGGLEGSAEKLITTIEGQDLPLVLKGEAISELANLARIRRDVADVFRQQIVERVPQGELEDPIILLRLLEFENTQDLDSINRLVKYSFSQVVSLLRRFINPDENANVYADATRPIREYLNGNLLKELRLNLYSMDTRNLARENIRQVRYLRELISDHRNYIKYQLSPCLFYADVRKTRAAIRILRDLYSQEPENCFELCHHLMSSDDPHILHEIGAIVGAMLANWLTNKSVHYDPLGTLRTMSLCQAKSNVYNHIVNWTEAKDLFTLVELYTEFHKPDISAESTMVTEALQKLYEFLKSSMIPTKCCAICGASVSKDRGCYSCQEKTPPADYTELLGAILKIRSLKGPVEVGHHLGAVLDSGDFERLIGGVLRQERLRLEGLPIQETRCGFTGRLFKYLREAVFHISEYRSQEFSNLFKKIKSLTLAYECFKKARDEVKGTGRYVLDRPVSLMLENIFINWISFFSSMERSLTCLYEALNESEPEKISIYANESNEFLSESEIENLRSFLIEKVSVYARYENSNLKKLQLLSLLNQLINHEKDTKGIDNILPLLSAQQDGVYSFIYPHILNYLKSLADKPPKLARTLIQIFAQNPPPGFFTKIASDLPCDVTQKFALVIEGDTFTAAADAAEVVTSCGPYIRMSPFLKVLSRAGSFHYIEEFAGFFKQSFSPTLIEGVFQAQELAQWAGIKTSPNQTESLNIRLNAINSEISSLIELDFNKIEERVWRLRKLREHLTKLKDFLNENFPMIPEKALLLRAVDHWITKQPGIESLLASWELLRNEIKSRKINSVTECYAEPRTREKLGLLPQALVSFKNFLVRWNVEQFDFDAAMALRFKRPGVAPEPFFFSLSVLFILLLIILITPLAVCRFSPSIGGFLLVAESTCAVLFFIFKLYRFMSHSEVPSLVPPKLFLVILIGFTPLLLFKSTWMFALSISGISFLLILAGVGLCSFLLILASLRERVLSIRQKDAWRRVISFITLGIIHSYLISLVINLILTTTFIVETDTGRSLEGTFLNIFPKKIFIHMGDNVLLLYPPVILSWTLIAFMIAVLIRTFVKEQSTTESIQ